MDVPGGNGILSAYCGSEKSVNLMEAKYGKNIISCNIHGNMSALRALEKELEKLLPDEIWFLGDAVGKGPEDSF